MTQDDAEFRRVRSEIERQFAPYSGRLEVVLPVAWEILRRVMMTAPGDFERFPTKGGEYPDDWTRAQLARGCVVVQIYSADELGHMRRSQGSFTVELVRDAPEASVARYLYDLLREHVEIGPTS